MAITAPSATLALPTALGPIGAVDIMIDRNRMPTELQGSVVIANPTHYAVTLGHACDRDLAPRSVAKGGDSMAARIRGAAARHRLPRLVNPSRAAITADARRRAGRAA